MFILKLKTFGVVLKQKTPNKFLFDEATKVYWDCYNKKKQETSWCRGVESEKHEMTWWTFQENKTHTIENHILLIACSIWLKIIKVIKLPKT